jgi:hypothetical protein
MMAMAAIAGRRVFIPSLVIVAVLGAIRPATATVLAELSGTPTGRTSTLYSTNWSGYGAAAGSGQTFASVVGSWTVPAVTPSASGDTYSCHWIGLDGFNSGTVEQIGTESDVINGSPVYFAWFEFYPDPEMVITNLAVSPGDQMTALVRYDGLQTSGQYQGQYAYFMALLNVTTNMEVNGALYTSYSGAHSSAEWIAEAPSVDGDQSALANFGSVTFTDSSAALDGGDYVVISGLANSPIDLITSQGKIIAHTSGLNETGDGFSVTVLPEPSTLSLLVCSTIGLLWRRLRKRRPRLI